MCLYTLIKKKKIELNFKLLKSTCVVLLIDTQFSLKSTLLGSTATYIVSEISERAYYRIFLVSRESNEK